MPVPSPDRYISTLINHPYLSLCCTAACTVLLLQSLMVRLQKLQVSSIQWGSASVWLCNVQCTCKQAWLNERWGRPVFDLHRLSFLV